MFLCFFTSIVINWSHFNEKNKEMLKKKAISMYQFCVIGDLMVNYMEIQKFVGLSCISWFSLLRYTWNDHENVCENCENVLEKVL